MSNTIERSFRCPYHHVTVFIAPSSTAAIGKTWGLCIEKQSHATLPKSSLSTAMRTSAIHTKSSIAILLIPLWDHG